MSWTNEPGFEPIGAAVVAQPVYVPPTRNSSMLPISVVIPFCRGDKDQAIRLLTWIAELGKVDAHCVLIAPKACDPAGLLPLAFKAFSHASLTADNEDIQCNWQHQDVNMIKSAEGPNSLFRQAAWHMSLNKLGPWLFLEPDSAPIVPDWLEQICAEYIRAGRPFMGDRVDESTHPGKIGLTVHMSGVAVYPERTPAMASEAVVPTPVAFDVAGARQIVPNAHFVDGLIMHRFRAATFISQRDLEMRLNPKCVLFHASKDGSLIRLLREKRNGYSGVPAPSVTFSGGPGVRVEQSPTPDSPGRVNISFEDKPTCDLFIKTHPADYGWLTYCLRSINKFVTGFRKVLLVAPDGSVPDPHYLNVKAEVVIDADVQPGYLHQQKVKLEADAYTDADFIVYMDSDCLFTRPVTPADFIKDGKPIWIKKPMSEARPDEQKTWNPVLEKFMGHKPDHHFMVRHNFCATPELLKAMRQFCKYKHGVELSAYIMGQAVPGNPLALTFSEWQCLGAFCHEFEHDKVSWVEAKDAPATYIKQFWSHGGMLPEHRLEMDRILTTPTINDVEAAEIQHAKALHGIYTTAAEEFAGNLSKAISALVLEASKSNISKARVLKQIKQAGLVKGGKLQKV